MGYEIIRPSSTVAPRDGGIGCINACPEINIVCCGDIICCSDGLCSCGTPSDIGCDAIGGGCATRIGERPIR